MTFEEYWEKYGKLQAAECGGNIKLFAQEVWDDAIHAALKDILEAKERESLRQGE